MAKKSTGSTKAAKGTKTEVVSFRLAPDLYKILEDRAKGERDESGMPLNVSGMARRLVIAAITKPQGKKPNE